MFARLRQLFIKAVQLGRGRCYRPTGVKCKIETSVEHRDTCTFLLGADCWLKPRHSDEADVVLLLNIIATWMMYFKIISTYMNIVFQYLHAWCISMLHFSILWFCIWFSRECDICSFHTEFDTRFCFETNIKKSTIVCAKMQLKSNWTLGKFEPVIIHPK